jgi:hypothetical protein
MMGISVTYNRSGRSLTVLWRSSAYFPRQAIILAQAHLGFQKHILNTLDYG